MVARVAGWKIRGEVRRVMRRVFVGGWGWVRGGRDERLRDIGEWAPRRAERVVGEEEVEIGGVVVLVVDGCWGGVEGVSVCSCGRDVSMAGTAAIGSENAVMLMFLLGSR